MHSCLAHEICASITTRHTPKENIMNTFSLPYQEMLEQMPDSVIYADTEGKIRFWNAASEQMFGFTA